MAIVSPLLVSLVGTREPSQSLLNTLRLDSELPQLLKIPFPH